MADQEEGGNKYAYLLQPLKDLDKNFSIDIISLLDDYTQQLAALANQEQFEVDNAHRFNFAEAAMLIQGSVNIFGKKVDHVYSQAVNFFDTLKSSKKSKKASADHDDEGFENDMDDEEVAERNERMSVTDPCALQDFGHLKPASVLSLVMKRTNVKVPTISVMPMSLMPLADFEKCNVPIYSHKKSKDIIGKKDDFKINTGYMGPRGALLLDLLNSQILDNFASDNFMQLGIQTEEENEKDDLQATQDDADSGRATPDEFDEVENNLPGLNEGRPSAVVEQCRRDTCDTVIMTGRPSTVLGNDSFCGGDDDDDFSNAPPLPTKEPWEQVDEGFEPDPFEELYMDSYEEVKWKRHPLKVGKCSISSLPLAEKRKKEEKKLQMREKTMQTIQFINEHFYMKSHKDRLNINKGDDWETDALFRYIIQQQKERAASKKQKLAAQKNKAKNMIAAQLEEEEDILGGIYDDDDVEDEGPKPKGDFPVGTQTEGQTMNPIQSQTLRASQAHTQPVLFNDIDDDELRNSMNIPSLYIGKQPTAANINDHGSEMRAPHADAKPTSDMTTEEILNFYMHKYWTSAQEATSRLAVRVQEWEEKMVPLLEEEETRKEFDIHEYGSYALDLFGESGQTKQFSEICTNRKYYEISRYFLASLMLANTYNLKIEDDQQLGVGMETNTMRATLLKRDRHHEVFNQDGAL